MTTKPKPLKPRADDVRGETLQEFSDLIDAHMGAKVGFADHVTGLYLVRADLASIKAARKTANDRVKELAALGETRGGGYEVRQSAPTPVVVKRAVPSAAVQKLDKALWAAAKVPTPFVQVKPHPTAPAAVSSLRLPRMPERGGLAAVIEHLKVNLPGLKDLTEVQQDHLDALDKIGANAGWDGLPIEFADRWLVSLRRLQYDSERLREIAPEAWERLAVSKPTGGITRTYLARLDGGADSFDESVDLDGE